MCVRDAVNRRVHTSQPKGHIIRHVVVVPGGSRGTKGVCPRLKPEAIGESMRLLVVTHGVQARETEDLLESHMLMMDALAKETFYHL